MYEAHFNLSHRPFPSAPATEFYFPAAAIEEARNVLGRCVRRGEGTGVVIGPTGTGKTLLCQVLARELADELRVVHLGTGRLGTRRALLQAILYELGQAYRGMDEGEARLAVVDYLTTSDDCARGLALLVDESHSLPLRLLDEVRMLTNLGRDGRPLVRLVLVGSCALEERLAAPKLDSFNQRIVARCYLETFNRDETIQYIHAQLAAVGGTPEQLFAEPAARAVHAATDGVPRLINQLCDHALLMAWAAGGEGVSADLVEQAWADLQQLPTPWTSECAARPGGGSEGVIEFGGLNDDEQDAALDTSGNAADAGGSGADVANIPQLTTHHPPDDEPSGDAPASATIEFGGLDDDEPTGGDCPPLRISSFDDDDDQAADADEVDLTGRVDQIAELLDESVKSNEPVNSGANVDDVDADAEDADWDDADFQPAGRIQPEVDLHFTDESNPFDEDFQEEEVVGRRPPAARPPRSAEPPIERPAEQHQRAEEPAPDAGAAHQPTLDDEKSEESATEPPVAETSPSEPSGAGSETLDTAPSQQTVLPNASHDVESPAVEMPSVEMSSVESPDVEVPRVDVPHVESPAVEMPAVEMPSAESRDVAMSSVDVSSIELSCIAAPMPVIEECAEVNSSAGERPGETRTVEAFPMVRDLPEPEHRGTERRLHPELEPADPRVVSSMLEIFGEQPRGRRPELVVVDAESDDEALVAVDELGVDESGAGELRIEEPSADESRDGESRVDQSRADQQGDDQSSDRRPASGPAGDGPRARPSTPVAPGQYRHLFAQLRRG